MRKAFKKSYLIIDIFLSIFILFFLFNIFFIKNTSFIFSGITTTILFLILYFIFGFEKKNRRFTYETMFYICSYTVIYLISTYIIGIFSGFDRMVYTFSFSTLIKNIIPYLILIISSELLRSEITRKVENSLSPYVLVTILLVIVDCTIYLTTFNLSTGDGQIQFICNILLPSVSKNIMLLYISRIGGMYPTTIYRLLTELKMFIVPIEPSFGLYIDSVLSTIMPTILGFVVYFQLKQYQNKEVEGKSYKQSKLYVYISVIIIGLFIVLMVTLTSQKFMYAAISIGSGSMTGTINKGDVVVYKKIGEYEPVVDDVLVFKKDGKLIVHRIIEVVDINSTDKVYYTKGDANPTPDGYPLTKKDLVGIVKLRVKYLGIPSVYLNELLNK